MPVASLKVAMKPVTPRIAPIDEIHRQDRAGSNFQNSMSAKIITKTKIILELTPFEASMIKSIVQNPLTEEESDKQREAREVIFNAIPPYMDLHKMIENEQ